jgi:hypothetical protein
LDFNLNATSSGKPSIEPKTEPGPPTTWSDYNYIFMYESFVTYMSALQIKCFELQGSENLVSSWALNRDFKAPMEEVKDE